MTSINTQPVSYFLEIQLLSISVLPKSTVLQSVCVHTDLFPEDALLDACTWVPAKHRPDYISRSCSSTLSWGPPALSSTLHMAARSRGLLAIFFVPGCTKNSFELLPTWASHIWLCDSACHSQRQSSRTFPRQREHCSGTGTPEARQTVTPLSLPLPQLPTGNWGSMLETQRRPGVLGDQGGPLCGERGGPAARGLSPYFLPLHPLQPPILRKRAGRLSL